MNINFLTKLPNFKGKRRLAKFLLGSDFNTKKDIVVAGKYNLKYLIPNLVENIGFDIMVNGIYEMETLEFIISRLPRNGIFLDIGANIGAIVLPVCKLRSDISAIAVEASSNVFSYLIRNAEINGIGNILLKQIAISQTDDENLNFYSPAMEYGKGSFSPVFTKTPEIVKTMTIETLLKRENIKELDFIKVDVEGYEYFVFKGGEAIFQNAKAPDILFEFLHWTEELVPGLKTGDAQRVLLEYGYSIYKVVDNISVKLDRILTKGSAMLFASKKTL